MSDTIFATWCDMSAKELNGRKGRPTAVVYSSFPRVFASSLACFCPGALVLTMRPASLLRELWIMKWGTYAGNHQNVCSRLADGRLIWEMSTSSNPSMKFWIKKKCHLPNAILVHWVYGKVAQSRELGPRLRLRKTKKICTHPCNKVPAPDEKPPTRQSAMEEYMT